MKTYQKTTVTTEPRLVIRYDEDIESPREWGPIGYFFTKSSRYNSPDGKDHELYRIMLEAEEEATDTASHIEAIKRLAKKEYKETKDEDLNIVAIYPTYMYEHSNVVYRRGTAKGFDYSNNGFYIVTKKSLNGEKHTTKKLEAIIDGELETYTKWANGEVYGFFLYDQDGEEIDACGGFYDIDDIKEHLPEEWANENLSSYIKY